LYIIQYEPYYVTMTRLNKSKQGTIWIRDYNK